MRFFQPFILAWSLCVSVAVAQSGSAPDDLYFDGFQAWQAGQRLEQEGNKQGALQKYLEAHKTIQSVGQLHPQWQPDVVSYRLKNVEQSLSRLGYTVPLTTAGPVLPAPVAPGLAAPGLTPAPAAPVPGAAPVGSITNLIDQQFQELQRQNADMASKLRLYQDGYQNALKDRKKAEDDRDILITRMQTVNATLDKLTRESSAKDTAAQAEVQRLRNESKMLSDMMAAQKKQFDDNTKAIETLTKERDALLASKKQLESELSVARSAVPGDMGKLMAENARLKSELDTARKQIDTLKAEGVKKDEEIAGLKTQIKGIQTEIAKLRLENTNYQTKVAELTAKYKEMNNDLQKPGSGKPDSQLAKENETLRQIIMRHLRTQQRLLTSKELVIQEMKKLEITSQSLMENLEDMTSGKVRITVDEESLFTDDDLKVIIAAQGGVNATLEARSTSAKSKSKSGAKKGAEPAPGLTPPLAANGKQGPGSPLPLNPAALSSLTPEERLMVQAEQALRSEEFGAAEKLLQDVLRANPKNATALISMAEIKRKEKKQTEAEVLLQKCLVYEPANASALYWLGVCQFQQKRLPDALATFEKCVLNDKKNARAHHYLGIISNEMGNRRRAEVEFKNALAIDPEYGDAYFNLAVLYATAEPPELDKARDNYRNALRRGINADQSLDKLLESGPGTPPGAQGSPTAEKAPEKTASR